MSYSNSGLEADFINNLIQNQTPTLIYLQNSICINGFLLAEDRKILVAKDKAGIQVLYKKGISSIVEKT